MNSDPRERLDDSTGQILPVQGSPGSASGARRPRRPPRHGDGGLKIGLALSGGGARGLGHAAAIAALDDLGIRPAAIAGSSIGALMGVGTAAGITGRDLAALAAAHFLDRRTFLGKLWQLRPPRFLDLFGPSGSLIQPERIVDLVLPDHLPETFEGLSIPFTAVAADYYGWREVRLAAGDLRSAIAGSIAIPGLFRPVTRDDVVLVDGSIVNPMPFDVLPDDLDLVIAVDVVNGPSRRGKRLIPPPRRALFGSIQILMQAVVQEKLRRRQPDVVLRPDINRFGVLDFLKAREILAAAEPLRESAKRTIGEAIEARLAAPLAAPALSRRADRGRSL